LEEREHEGNGDDDSDDDLEPIKEIAWSHDGVPEMKS